MNLYYGAHHALKNVNIDIPERQVTALIGPSGCGKSTFLKTLNRMNDLSLIHISPTRWVPRTRSISTRRMLQCSAACRSGQTA